MGLPGSFLDSTLFLPTSPLFPSSSPEFFLADSLRSGVSFNILFFFFRPVPFLRIHTPTCMLLGLSDLGLDRKDPPFVLCFLLLSSSPS